MNPYRSRSSGTAVNRIAVAFVVLIALGAIGASVLLGPKPNATVVLMQPIRPAQTASVPTAGQTAAAPSSDPVANVSADQLPVIESRPAKAVTTDPKPIERSELGIETPPAATPTPMTASSSAPITPQTSSAQSPAQTPSVQAPAPTASAAPGAQTVITPSAPTTVTPTASASTETVKPVTAAPAASSTQNPGASSVTRPDSSPTAPVKTPETAPSSDVPASPAASPSSSSAKPAAPTGAFLRRATNGVSVQVVALSNLDAAVKLSQNLAANGFTANVQPNGKIFRVVIGPYANEAAAQAAAARASAYIR